MNGKALLACGLLSSLLYAAMTVMVPMYDANYSSLSQTVSELSALGAPTRAVWVPLGVAYGLLLAAFGWGILQSAGSSRALRIVGMLFLAHALLGFFWPPMQQRGAPMAPTDIGHIAFAIVVLLVMLSSIALGAAALGGPFRVYSLVTIAVFVVFGALTALDAPRLAANLPTPWIGLWERINIAAYMAWVAVLSLALIARQRAPARHALA